MDIIMKLGVYLDQLNDSVPWSSLKSDDNGSSPWKLCFKVMRWLKGAVSYASLVNIEG
jgi:hypothetical protein